MFLELSVLSGPHDGRCVTLDQDSELTVGRIRHKNGLWVPDPILAPIHFGIARRDAVWTLSDLRSSAAHEEAAGFRSGLIVNGRSVQVTPIGDGDVIVAGSTCFRVALREQVRTSTRTHDASSGGPVLQSAVTRVLNVLTQGSGTWFAVLDAARDTAVLETLLTHEESYWSLYDGRQGERLSDVAPYLVQLTPGSPLTSTLVRERWGQSWAVFLRAELEPLALRRHLRRFLMVETQQGKRLHFRFYDPRVLRAFLPTCTAAELEHFLGPIHSFMVEAEGTGAPLIFSREERSRVECRPFAEARSLP